MPFKPGDTVDRYVIEALLGSGGMGEVYRARDTRLHRRVALKILHEQAPEAATGSRPSSEGAARILREARAAAALDHANVVAVFDVGQIDTPGEQQGMTFLAMELIKGSSLRAYIGDTRVPIGERVRWLIDVARALAAAHQVGLVHRDIKPENVMVREDGQVKVLDFGIARRAHGPVDPTLSTEELLPATAKSMTSGTPVYMAPEQLRAEPLDGRADQFGWGVLAYELLTGTRPWALEHGMVALVAQVLSRTPTPIEGLAPEVPAYVAAAVARALQKDRAARFASMGELIEALGGGRTTPTVPPPRRGDPLAPTQRSSIAADAGTPAMAPTAAAFETAPGSTHPAPLPATAPAAPRRRTMRAAIGAGVLVLVVGSAVATAVRPRVHRAPAVASGALDGTSGLRPAWSTLDAAAAAAPGCASNKGCVDAHGGEPWICRAADHTCVSLASEDCTVSAEPGDVELDSTAWIGTILPLKGELGKYFKAASMAGDLARQDFAGTLGKIGNARRIAVVSCDGSGDVQRAARHLANDVQVPAVLLGILETSDIVEIVSKVFTPAGVLTMLPHSSSPAVTALPQGPSGRLVWRSTFGVQSLLDTEAALIEHEVEPQWKQRAPGQRTRVAYLHPKNVMFRVLSDRLFSVLRFNGKSAVDNGDDFREIAYDEGGASYASARAEITSFRPSIVILVTADEFQQLIQGVEQHWPPGVPRPTYVFPFSLSPELVPFIAASPERRRRFFGMDTVSATIANADFVNHYNETFGTKIARIEAPNNMYDGFYALAYAIYALGGARVTGPSMASAFRRLAGPGKTLSVGPHAIFDAYTELRSGGSIDLEGAAGHLDLDPDTGESTFDITILCAAPGHGTPALLVESGLVYSQRERQFTGTLACP